MNILHIRASNFYGGPERQLHYHARETEDSKYQLTIGSFTEGGKRPEFLEVIAIDGIKTVCFEVRSAYDTRALRLLREYLQNEDVAVLCTHDYRTGLLGYLATRNIPTKWVAFSRGYTQDNIKVRLYHTIDRLTIRFADRIVAVSRAQKERLRRLLIRTRKISVVPNGIDPRSFIAVEPVDLRNRFGFDTDTVLCICGGRFSREKGQEYLVKAASEAIKSDGRLRFVLFGDGPDLNKIRSMIRSLNCEGKIICPGFEKNLIGCLKGADILVNPSLSEGLPNIVLEAMAVQVAVIATAVGGVPEIILDGETGYLVRPREVASLAGCMIRVARDVDTRVKTTTAAGEFVLREYSFSGQFKRLAELYDAVTS